MNTYMIEFTYINEYNKEEEFDYTTIEAKDRLAAEKEAARYVNTKYGKYSEVLSIEFLK